MSRRSEAGDSKIGCAIWILLLAVVVMIGWQVIPVKIAGAELEDYMQERAQFAGHLQASYLRQEVVHRARELNLPLDEKNVTVEKFGAGQVRMQATYTVVLKFPFYRHEWTIVHDVQRSSVEL